MIISPYAAFPDTNCCWLLSPNSKLSSLFSLYLVESLLSSKEKKENWKFYYDRRKVPSYRLHTFHVER